MISIIIASYKEEKLIGRAIESVVKGNCDQLEVPYEIIQVSSDKETLEAGMSAAKQLDITDVYRQIQDPRKGKAFALNMVLDEAKGEIVVMTDGDVYMIKGAIPTLLSAFKDDRIGGVTGQPVPINSEDSFMGYLAHLTTAAADNKRRQVFNDENGGIYSSPKVFFPMSGYLLAYRNNGFRYNPNYIDDTFISLKVLESGLSLAYAPEAKVNVYFPTKVKDYLVQRRRNLQSTKEIHKSSEANSVKDPRSLSEELKYMMFPIYFATNFKEIVWSLLFYPFRLLTWIYSKTPQKKRGKSLGWDVIGSTKK